MNTLRPLSGDVLPLSEPRLPARPGEGGFAGELGKALSAVEELQREADRETDRLARGAGNLHETALALEKADVALRLVAKIRTKIVEAYQEVMRMPV